MSRSSLVIGSILLAASQQHERCPASPYSPTGLIPASQTRARRGHCRNVSPLRIPPAPERLQRRGKEIADQSQVVIVDRSGHWISEEDRPKELIKAPLVLADLASTNAKISLLTQGQGRGVNKRKSDLPGPSFNEVRGACRA